MALGGILFEGMLVDRATLFEYEKGVALLTCSAEDLVVLKAFADRSRDWAYVEGILLRQRGDLDWDYIVNQLEPLCTFNEAPHIIERLEKLRDIH